MKCPVCLSDAKLNELVRSAYHVLGCVACYGKAPSPLAYAEAMAARQGTR